MTTYEGGSFEAFDINAPADRLIQDFTGGISRLDPAVDLRFQIESKDLEKRTVTMSIHGNLISQSFKTVKVTFTVTPREYMTSSSVELTVDFEKNSQFEEHMVVCRAVEEHIRFIGCYLNKLSLNAKVQAHKCFKAFIEAFEHDADVKIEAKDGDNLTTTMSLRSTHKLMEGYKTIKVTTTITHLEDNKGSHMRWTIETDKTSDHIKLEDLSTANSIRYMILDKLSHLRIY